MQTFTVVISGEFLRMSLCCTHPAVYNYEEVIKAIKDGQATRSLIPIRACTVSRCAYRIG
jgi:hypothetical protein